MNIIIEKYIEFNKFGKELGLHFEIEAPGVVHHRLTIKPQHLATPAAVHGGVIAAMMDAVLGVAALSISSQNMNIVSTVEFKINYFNPCLLGDELIGESYIERAGKRIIIVSGVIKTANRNNEIIAKAMGTFNSYPALKVGLIGD
ncbi:MAG: PaaI family thioesterase [Bacteroidetes bacterium]|nr:PaaI family thioesterase [Bacteroidota bacterium]